MSIGCLIVYFLTYGIILSLRSDILLDINFYNIFEFLRGLIDIFGRELIDKTLGIDEGISLL